jgi:hypothetical protein
MQIPEFLKDETTRTLIGWLGGAAVVIVSGIWAVFRFLSSKNKRVEPVVRASRGGVAAGRDIRDSKIDARGDGNK